MDIGHLIIYVKSNSDSKVKAEIMRKAFADRKTRSSAIHVMP